MKWIYLLCFSLLLLSSVYAYGPTVSSDMLIYYKFDTGNESFIVDSSNFKNNASGVGLMNVTDGWHSLGINFTTGFNNNLTSVANVSINNISGHSIAGWFKVRKRGVVMPVVSLIPDYNVYLGYDLDAPSTHPGNLSIISADAGGYSYEINNVFNSNKWVHIVVTYDGSTHNFTTYINGTKRYSENLDPFNKMDGKLRLGNNAWIYAEASFNGTMDEFILYNKTLTPTEVKYLYNGYNLIENSQTYNFTTYETLKESFSINLSYDNVYYSSISAFFSYNNTLYTPTVTTDGSNVVITKSVDIPLIASELNNSFYWTFVLSNGTGTDYYNSSTLQQTVKLIRFVACNATYPTRTLNFTIYDEYYRTLINATIKATFNYRLNLTSTLSKNLSLTTVSNYTHEFCIDPNLTYYVNDYLQLSASGYNSREVNLLNEIYSNSKTNRPLFLTNESITNVYIQVIDVGATPLVGYTVKVRRYYQDLGAYQLVEQDVTDFYGQTVTKLVQNDVTYKIEVYNPAGTLVKETGNINIICRYTPCILQIVIADTEDDFERFKNETGVDYTFSYNNNTRVFLFSWTDTTSDSATYRMSITKYLANGTTLVYNSSSGLASGSLSYTAGTAKATYVSQIFRKVGSTERRLDVINVQIGDLSNTFGMEGLFVSFILLFTLVAIGSWNPPIGFIFYIAGLIMVGLFDIVYLPMEVMIAQVIIGIMFVWAFRG